MSPRTRKSRPIEMTWQHPTAGRSVRIRVEHTRNYLVAGTDHIEIHVIGPKKAVIPLTDTGYRSHFIDGVQLKEAGGVRRIVEQWLMAESQSKEWQKKDLARQQGDLFQWAQARAETGKRAVSKSAKRPTDKSRKRRTGGFHGHRPHAVDDAGRSRQISCTPRSNRRAFRLIGAAFMSPRRGGCRADASRYCPLAGARTSCRQPRCGASRRTRARVASPPYPEAPGRSGSNSS